MNIKYFIYCSFLNYEHIAWLVEHMALSAHSSVPCIMSTGLIKTALYYRWLYENNFHYLISVHRGVPTQDEFINFLIFFPLIFYTIYSDAGTSSLPAIASESSTKATWALEMDKQKLSRKYDVRMFVYLTLVPNPIV